MSEILKVTGLVKRYKELIALDNVSLSVREGEIFGLLGPNGSGKSTTINCILSLLEYDKGDMTVVQPDFIVVCDREKFSDIRAVKGAPDFVLEVLSPSTRKRDLNIKKKKYQENGVREYWIADPESRVVIKTVFEGEERSTMYTFEDDIPVYIYDGKLVVTLRDLEF